ncbi:MAG: hypothetical protein ACKV0T_14895 [Planctomycetales bacterium]
MINPELELFDANPQWRPLLSAYQAQLASHKLEWCPRIHAVDELPLDQLSAIHGKLIALGLLKFDIASRSEGVHYQVTTLGRQALLPAESRQIVPEWMVAENLESVAS